MHSFQKYTLILPGDRPLKRIAGKANDLRASHGGRQPIEGVRWSNIIYIELKEAKRPTHRERLEQAYLGPLVHN